MTYKQTRVPNNGSTQPYELLTYALLSVICVLAFGVMCYLIVLESFNLLAARREYQLALAERQPILIKMLENYRREQRLTTDKEYVKNIMKIRQGYVEQGEYSIAIEFEQDQTGSKNQ